MINIRSLHLENIVSYKNTQVSITDNCGFVIISGHNKDSKISESQNNGAGKSLLFSTLSNILYSASPTSTLKNTKKDMLSKGSSITLDFTTNNKDIKLVQSASKWSIFENDEDQKVHTIANQLVKIKEYFPLTQDEFYAYTYLSSIQGQRLHFQVDKPADRLKFITSIFQLDSYDKLKQHFTRKLSQIKDDQVKFDVIASKLLGINTQLGKLKWTKTKTRKLEVDKTKLKEIRKRISTLISELNTIDKEVTLCRTIDNNIIELSKLTTSMPNNSKISDIKKDLHASLKEIHRYEKYKALKQEFDKSTNKIHNTLETYDTYKGIEYNYGKSKRISLNKLKHEKTRINKINLLIEDAERIENKVNDLKDIIDNDNKAIKNLGFNFKTMDTTTDIEIPISAFRTTLRLRTLLEKDTSGSCPTCLQQVDIEGIKDSVDKAEQELGPLLNLKKARSFHKYVVENKSKLEAIDQSENLDKLLDRKEQIMFGYKDIKDKVKSLESIIRLIDTLNSLSEPDYVEEPSDFDIDRIHRRIDKCTKALNIKRNIRKYKDTYNIDDIPGLISSLDADKINKEKKLKQSERMYSDLMTHTSKCDNHLGEYRILTKQRLDLEKDLEGIKPILAKRDIYKALEKAYGSKGLKVNKANEIVSLIEDNLNKYSSLIFAEPFTFKVHADDSGISCLVSRNKGVESDVRLLSGSESDSFRLLFLLTMLILVSPERRTNIVVLDEPDSHMDSSTRNLFSDSYLPFLRTLVPHVFLITPNDVCLFQDYDHWTVVKHKGVSKLLN